MLCKKLFKISVALCTVAMLRLLNYRRGLLLLPSSMSSPSLPFRKTVLLICYDFRVKATPAPDELLRDTVEDIWDSVPTDQGPVPRYIQAVVNPGDP